jgi:hypothetical protein
MAVHTYDSFQKRELLLFPQSTASFNTAWIQPFVGNAAVQGAVACNRYAFELVVGDVTNNLDMKITQATTAAGAGAKDVTGALIAQITTSTDRTIVTIDLAPGVLDDNNGYTFVRAEIVIAAAGTGLLQLTGVRYALREKAIGNQPTTYSQQIRRYN